MYKEAAFPARILIVKTSSLGDIVQSFLVVDELKRRFPAVQIDWVVDPRFAPLVSAHPHIRRAIGLNIRERRGWWQAIQELRKEPYDLLFDLQGNCKSGLITWLARASVKVGYDYRSVKEWPNILATHIRFRVSPEQNIRHFYLELISRYFHTASSLHFPGVRFQIGDAERKKVASILQGGAGPHKKIMVCPGSKWNNKQLRPSTWIAFLQKIDALFFLVWGDEQERALCQEIASHLSHALVVDKLPVTTWQNLMGEMDLVMAVDSSALHLCATTSTPTFSIFGPTALSIFKPVGEHHFAIQGKCPYGRSFQKQCPVLRSCPTGACMKELTPEELFAAYELHFKS